MFALNVLSVNQRCSVDNGAAGHLTFAKSARYRAGMKRKYGFTLAIQQAAILASRKEEGGMGQNELARRAKIDKGLMSRFLGRQASLSNKSLDRLALVLGLRVVKVAVKKGQ